MEAKGVAAGEEPRREMKADSGARADEKVEEAVQTEKKEEYRLMWQGPDSLVLQRHSATEGW